MVTPSMCPVVTTFLIQLMVTGRFLKERIDNSEFTKFSPKSLPAF